MRNDLSALFRQAREYGLLHIYNSDDGTFSCKISFNSIQHTKLEAHSGFNHLQPEDAVEKAITVARQIVQSFVEKAEKMKALT